MYLQVMTGLPASKKPVLHWAVQEVPTLLLAQEGGKAPLGIVGRASLHAAAAAREQAARELELHGVRLLRRVVAGS